MKNTISVFFLVAFTSLFLVTSNAWAQEEENFQRIFENLTSYAITNYPEKGYLHTDKDYYRVGETIWFKAYLVNGVTHRKSDLSNVVYVELWGNAEKPIAQKIIQMDSLGGAGNISLDSSLAEGDYVLRAYTKYMLNEKEPRLFQKQLTIWVNEFGSKSGSKETDNVNESEGTAIQENKTISPSGGGRLELKFFPEGGTFISQSANTIGFQICNEKGRGVLSSGSIINQNGENVLEFKSDRNGLGSFQIRPKEGDEYFAVVADSEELFKLPSPKKDNYKLQVQNNGDHLVIKVDAPTAKDSKPTMLLGHMRGNIFFKHIAGIDSESSYARKLLLDELDQGMAQFILFDGNGNILNDRLTFINNTKNLASLHIAKVKASFHNREKVELRLSLKDEKSRNLNGNISISVRKRNLEGTQKKSDIKNWLLLDSDLGQTSDFLPNFFKENSIQNKNSLEALLMGRSWERFSKQNLLKTQVSKNPKYEPEKGIFISGRTTNVDNQNVPKKAKLTLGILEGSFFTQTQNTDHQGKFNFGPLAFNDSVQIVLDAIDPLAKKKEESKAVGIHLDTLSILPLIRTVEIQKNNMNRSSTKATLAETKNDYLRIVEALELPKNVIQLEETVVKERRKIKTNRELVDERLDELTPYSKPTHRLLLDSTNITDGARLVDIMALIPGVRVRGVYPDQSIRLTRALYNSVNLSTSPLLVIDGVPLIPIDESVASRVDFNTMDTFGIMFIDVLTGADAAYYGARGANGVIAMYTHQGGTFDFSEPIFSGILSVTVKGFDVPEVFPAPNYSIKKPEHSKPDYRNTLHWEPNIVLSKTKETEISFFTDDSYGEYVVEVQGVLSNGQVVSEETSFVVE
ncbi:TonB-dependent receptor [Flagellimonas allohymeniacidonis]|uniref:TonB-dependent receptor plug domain-containing protein n=1 Tax=Flagellimonas allohymeniacidonis TaxID=2517819 RepID=A0A4Q8QEB3_9FLAO|nr:Plug domain-containing protein [Allomuricauda hymeniacidonis]TAI48842.1 hypothetical protein EW142_03325 [Allomuricauda hymeniacidonis]